MNKNTLILVGAGVGAAALIYLYCRGEMFESASRFMLPYFVTGWEAQMGQRLPCEVRDYAAMVQRTPVHREQAGRVKELVAKPCCGGCAH